MPATRGLGVKTLQRVLWISVALVLGDGATCEGECCAADCKTKWPKCETCCHSYIQDKPACDSCTADACRNVYKCDDSKYTCAKDPSGKFKSGSLSFVLTGVRRVTRDGQEQRSPWGPPKKPHVFTKIS
jgi:hypothetical protein